MIRKLLYVATLTVFIAQVLLFVGSHGLQHGVYAILLQGALDSLEEK